MEEQIWTEAQRARHKVDVRSTVKMLSVGQVAGRLKQADPAQSGRAAPTVGLIGVIDWRLRFGDSWGALPVDHPHWRTIYGWFRRWGQKGPFGAIMCHVARLRRWARAGHHKPRLAVVDT